jgi:DNA-binding SARP family transcriptional activator
LARSKSWRRAAACRSAGGSHGRSSPCCCWPETGLSLIDGLWGESPPPSAARTLETYVSRLRRVLHPKGADERLVTQPPGYRMRVEPDELDLARFEALLDRARAARDSDDPETAADALRKALSLFRGAPLEDLAHAPFAEAEIGRLDDLRLDALEQRLEADLALGRHAEVVGELESLTTRHPFREALWSQLMLALYRSGRQGEALEAFDRARRTLSEELGVYPGQALKDLHRQILEQDPSLEPAVATAASGAPATSTGDASTEPTARSGDPGTTLARAPPPRAAEPPAPTPRGEDRPGRAVLPRRRAVAVGLPLILAVILAAILIPPLLAGDEADAEYRAATVLIDLATGKEIESIPRSELPVAGNPVFADGHFWGAQPGPAGLRRDRPQGRPDPQAAEPSPA